MEPSGKSQNSWWTTLPGLLTALAAIVTAVTGLLLGLNQIGLFEGSAPGSVSPAATRDGNVPKIGDNPIDPAQPATTISPGMSAYEATLPLNEPTRSGDVSYEIVGYELRPDSDGELALSIDIRMFNYGRYDVNFWNAAFRLLVGADSISPSGDLNEIVAGDASKVGTVLFVIPDTTRGAALKIKFFEGDRTIPFEVRPAGS
ncbi:MAG: hypothetical protein ACRDTG_32330 [Pseudonocardiaceae bacterium]